MERSEATVESLRRLRPDLLGAYQAESPGARAAILARLWGALCREPFPDVVARQRTGPRLELRFAGGARLSGDAATAQLYTVAPDGFAVRLDGASFDDAAALLLALPFVDPAVALRAQRLADELNGSVANLALARAAQPRPGGGPIIDHLARTEPTAALAMAEQLVVDGHPVHPCCRTRTPMSTADVLAYAPEHHPLVRLSTVEVPQGRWWSTGTGLPPRLVVHPWQFDRLRDDYPWLRPSGTIVARPQMSLRTLAPLGDAAYHLKTAVDVQMTSAVRTVSPAAVHNGPLLSALLRAVTADLPSLIVLTEPAGGAVVVDGEPSRSLAMLYRDAPAPHPGEVVVPLAALAARSPADGRPVVVEAVSAAFPGQPERFFADLVSLALPPLLTLLRRGIALEAHGQNTLVALRDGRPVRLYYRDLGGVRVSPRRLDRYGRAAPPLRGDLVDDDPDALRTKLFAAFLSGVLAELVAVLTREYGVRADALWRTVAQVARDAADQTDTKALFAPELPIKAMTVMRLSADPVRDVWTPQPNPLAAWA